MGYNTYFSGEIRIDPPLSWADTKDNPFVGGNSTKDIRLHVEEQTTDTAAGTLLVRTGTMLVPLMEDGYKGYHIVEDLQQFLDTYGAGRTFTGRLDAEGEDAGDLWRLTVRDGRAVKVTPRIVWPDDEPGGVS